MYDVNFLRKRVNQLRKGSQLFYIKTVNKIRRKCQQIEYNCNNCISTCHPPTNINIAISAYITRPFSQLNAYFYKTHGLLLLNPPFSSTKRYKGYNGAWRHCIYANKDELFLVYRKLAAKDSGEKAGTDKN